MMEFKALRVPVLTEDMAGKLETLLNNLTGVEQFTIALETQELEIVFDDKQLDFRTLAQEMAGVGCPWWNITAATFKQVSVR